MKYKKRCVVTVEKDYTKSKIFLIFPSTAAETVFEGCLKKRIVFSSAVLSVVIDFGVKACMERISTRYHKLRAEEICESLIDIMKTNCRSLLEEGARYKIVSIENFESCEMDDYQVNM